MLNHEKFLIAFGKHLRELRLTKNFSQEQLAYETNMQVKQLGRIERGEINTGIASIAIIAEVLKVTPKELFDFNY